MLSYPTDLTPDEQREATAGLRKLADQFTADGILRTPQWRAAFERTWRHPYVPSYYPEIDGPCLLSIDPVRRGEWLAAIYSDQTLVTKVVQVPMSRALRPGSSPRYASSSMMPSLMLRMLEALDVTDGSRVLEVGTGTGYNAALLCARLGSEHVTSVDIDPELVELARERLAANGRHPTLAVADGAGGYPAGAPYDRILATCGVPSIPLAWLVQARPGAVIVADVHGRIGGTVARLTVDGDGVASGRFLSFAASFMWMRSAATVSNEEHRWTDEDPMKSVTAVDPLMLRQNASFGFVAQWHLPDVTYGLSDEDGEPGIHLRAADGSQASAHGRPGGGRYRVVQHGPRRLWDRLEEAHAFWLAEGRPSYERFGVTAGPTGQYVWYDGPDSDHRWPLVVDTYNDK